jgi:hypothetical protein
METRLSNDLESVETNDDQAPSGKWNVETLRNLCPACFDITEQDEDTGIAFFMDGNVQHNRLKDKSEYEYKVLIPKLFVDYGRRQWPLWDNRNRVLLDGDVQHNQLKDKSEYEYKVLIPKLFVDYGRRQ